MNDLKGAYDVRLRSKTVDSRPRATRGVRLALYVQLLTIDIVAIVAGFWMAEAVRDAHWLSPLGINVAVLILPIYLGVAFNANAYSSRALRRPLEACYRALGFLLFALLAVLMVTFLVQADERLSRVGFVTGAAASAVLLLIGRMAFRWHIDRTLGRRLFNELVVLDGLPFSPQSGAAVIDATLAAIRPDASDPEMLNRFGTTVAGFDRVVIASAPERRAAWALFLKGVDVEGEILVPQFNEFAAIGFRRYAGHDTMLVSRGPLNLASRVKKRSLDLAVAVPLAVLFAPLMLAVAAAVAIESRGGVFFRQERVGRGNRLFHVLKFRSMRIESCDASGNRSTGRDDDRITKVGRLIRKTSIDELPQLLNVLRGDMSLVGPRPHALGSLAGDKLFWEVDHRYWHRHALKPGITGLAQVRGFRGATHGHADLANRLQADLEYMQDWNIWRDVLILIRTFLVVTHRNAY